MLVENYKYRFEIKPGKWVFVPTSQSEIDGKDITTKVLKKWSPPQHFYHFGKRGGHLGALRAHSISKYRASLDLKDFFGSVSRNKVSKSLRKVGFDQKTAFDISRVSCVSYEGRRFLPFGFTQSMVLATLAIDQSRLGDCLNRIRSTGGFVSMFVDDLIISGDSFEELEDTYDVLSSEIPSAGFVLSESKCIRPTGDLEVFNCKVGEGTLSITDDRMQTFRDQLLHANQVSREAILRYVSVINPQQAKELE
jgi:hypothetical protein